jgi:methionyl aminopeptidase
MSLPRWRSSVAISIKSRSELDKMRRAGEILAETFRRVAAAVKPGATTADVDRVAEDCITEHGAKPAFKGYRVAGRVFPATICASVNEEVVHGIPSIRRVLREGDNFTVDMGAIWEGYYSDAAFTFAVGGIATLTPEILKLNRVCREALYAGIQACRPGNRVRDIAAAVQARIEQEPEGYGIVQDLVGHGIGTNLHEEPQVPNTTRVHPEALKVKLRPGMCIAIEPMVNLGTQQVKLLDDGWTYVTADGRWSSHFEHSIAITTGDPEVLTEWTDGAVTQGTTGSDGANQAIR